MKWREFLLQLQERHLPGGSVRARLAGGAFWSLLGSAITQAMNVVVSIIVARALGKVIYGELGMILSTVTMFVSFAGLGLGLTANKHIAQYRNLDPDRTGRIMAMAAVVANFSAGLMAATLYLLAPWLAERVINAPHLVLELRLGALILFLSAINSAQSGALSGFEAFKTLAGLRIILALLYLPLIVGGVYWWSLKGAVAGLAIWNAVSWLLYHLALRREARKAAVPVSFRRFLSELGLLWSFSTPSVLSGMVAMAAMWAVNAFLVNQPEGYGEIGIFRAATQWGTALAFFPGIISQTVLPILSNLLGEGRQHSAVKIMLASMGINALAILLPGFILAAASPWIMALYGAGFREGWPVLVATVVSTLLMAVMTPVGNIMAAAGRMWAGFLMNLGWATVLLLSCMAFLPKGALGLALAYVTAYGFHGLWVFYYTYSQVLKRAESLSVEEIVSSGEVSE